MTNEIETAVEHLRRVREKRQAELQAMTLEQAVTEISNRVYEATQLYEQLEYAGKVRGNGHHMRQKMAALAEDLMKERWLAPRDDQ